MTTIEPVSRAVSTVRAAAPADTAAADTSFEDVLAGSLGDAPASTHVDGGGGGVDDEPTGEDSPLASGHRPKPDDATAALLAMTLMPVPLPPPTTPPVAVSVAVSVAAVAVEALTDTTAPAASPMPEPLVVPDPITVPDTVDRPAAIDPVDGADPSAATEPVDTAAFSPPAPSVDVPARPPSIDHGRLRLVATTVEAAPVGMTSTSAVEAAIATGDDAMTVDPARPAAATPSATMTHASATSAHAAHQTSRAPSGGGGGGSTAGDASGHQPAPNDPSATMTGPVDDASMSARLGLQSPGRSRSTPHLDIDLGGEGMGPMRLRTSTVGGQLRVSIAATDAHTRAALSTHSAELRRDFEASGLDLASLDVSSSGTGANSHGPTTSPDSSPHRQPSDDSGRRSTLAATTPTTLLMQHRSTASRLDLLL